VDTQIIPEWNIALRERIESIVLGILFGVLGAWQAMAGLGLIKMNISGMRDPGLVASGLMFFFAGALSFFKGTLGPAGRDTPTYRWTDYLMILLILLGFGFIFFWAGIVDSNIFVLFLGLVVAAAVVWFAIARWPGKGKLQ
jgi:hypothetical protein